LGYKKDIGNAKWRGIMTRVVVAAGLDNELASKDISSLKRLLQAGYDVEFFYYLPRVPPEYSMIPSFNEKLNAWKAHAAKILDKVGSKLSISTKHRHFVDEILGPNRLFDEARDMQADIILTNHKDELKESMLAKFYDRVGELFTGKRIKKVPTENVSVYTEKRLGPAQLRLFQPALHPAVNDPSRGVRHITKRLKVRK
jgi:hypothetical protein